MVRQRLSNGRFVNLTIEEEAARDAEEAAAPLAREALKDAVALAEGNRAGIEAVLRLLWDLETRMRAAGQTSGIAPIAAASGEADYKSAFVAYVRAQL